MKNQPERVGEAGDVYADALAGNHAWPCGKSVVWAGAAGLADTVGLLAFYRAWAVGRMGIAAPITAVLSAATPTLFDAFFQGLPQPLHLAGFVLAVWVLSRSD